MFNKTPKYSVNDIVIIDKGFSYEYGYSVVVGIINDVYNHRDTGEVFYHIIFNSGTPRKIFEYEIKTKFNTDRFKDGQSIYKQLLVQMYHTRSYKYLTEKEVLEWVDANFFKEEKQSTMFFPNYKFDHKFIENMMYPVKSSLTALEELNRKEVERITASPIRIDIDDVIKANYSKEEIKKMINKEFGVSGTYTYNLYKKIIFNGPCTIILWTDGSKTIAKTSGGEVFDPEKGVAVCFMKKMLGHTEANKVLRKASKQYEDYIVENGILATFFDDLKAYLNNPFVPDTKSVDNRRD